MLLTLRTTHRPATDLGYLLHKHPEKLHSFDLSFGQAHIFYPEVSEEACTAALLLDVDPVGLVRGRSAALDQYVNDRPYVASSFLSVAIARTLASALGGRSRERPELAETAIPLQARISVIPCWRGEELLRRLFEPLGYAMEIEPHRLDPGFPEWGARHFTVTLAGVLRLSELLAHLYVLVPVLDDEKHYFVDEAEVEKLVRHGGDWLRGHPERDFIARRYLKHQRSLVEEAVSRLLREEPPGEAPEEQTRDAEEAALERPLGLHEQRLREVAAELAASGARRVIDLGCGEGRLLEILLADPQFTEVAGMDVSWHGLERAKGRLDELPGRVRDRSRLFHGSLVYRDRRIEGYDAAALVEVIEHLDPPRLASLERVVFEKARPGTVVLTTPNADYNPKWERLPAGRFRHRDHRFEWTRAEFKGWGDRVAARHGYQVRYLPVGPEDPHAGAPTQMAVFTRG
ncbi:MAG: 3' terminal RNA ribose 2'-O-methyltransferase Hen1 [Thermoanaerobaculia bacterium]